MYLHEYNNDTCNQPLATGHINLIFRHSNPFLNKNLGDFSLVVCVDYRWMPNN
jgi:hypothetical protein